MDYMPLMYMNCDVIPPEEKKADDDTFETDLIAGRLQDEVVRVFSAIYSLHISLSFCLHH